MPHAKPTYPELNEKLLSCVLGYLEEHPEQHYQNTWVLLKNQGEEKNFCGTIGCIAGWACLLTVPEDQDWRRVNSLLGGSMSFQEAGQKKLGLTSEESFFLFAGTDKTGKAQLKEIKRRIGVIRQARAEGRNSPVELSAAE